VPAPLTLVHRDGRCIHHWVRRGDVAAQSSDFASGEAELESTPQTSTVVR